MMMRVAGALDCRAGLCGWWRWGMRGGGVGGGGAVAQALEAGDVPGGGAGDGEQAGALGAIADAGGGVVIAVGEGLIFAGGLGFIGGQGSGLDVELGFDGTPESDGGFELVLFGQQGLDGVDVAGDGVAINVEGAGDGGTGLAGSEALPDAKAQGLERGFGGRAGGVGRGLVADSAGWSAGGDGCLLAGGFVEGGVGVHGDGGRDVVGSAGEGVADGHRGVVGDAAKCRVFNLRMCGEPRIVLGRGAFGGASCGICGGGVLHGGDPAFDGDARAVWRRGWRTCGEATAAGRRARARGINIDHAFYG